ncbi:hypothetical protein ACFL2T_07750 [Elusimicrobiota bacterium]
MSTLFTDKERELLDGLVKAGMSLSAERMQKFSKSKWDILSSVVGQSSLEETRSSLGRDPDKHFGVHIRSRLPMPLEILLIFPYWGVDALVQTVTKGLGGALKSQSKVEEMVLAEIGNVLGQGLIASLADGLGVPLILTVPEVTCASQTSLFSGVLEKSPADRDTILLSKVEMASGEICTSCSMLLLLDAGSIKPLLRDAVAKRER